MVNVLKIFQMKLKIDSVSIAVAISSTRTPKLGFWKICLGFWLKLKFLISNVGVPPIHVLLGQQGKSRSVISRITGKQTNPNVAIVPAPKEVIKEHVTTNAQETHLLMVRVNSAQKYATGQRLFSAEIPQSCAKTAVQLDFYQRIKCACSKYASPMNLWLIQQTNVKDVTSLAKNVMVLVLTSV
jgi:hypothetical protein